MNILIAKACSISITSGTFNMIYAFKSKGLVRDFHRHNISSFNFNFVRGDIVSPCRHRSCTDWLKRNLRIFSFNQLKNSGFILLGMNVIPPKLTDVTIMHRNWCIWLNRLSPRQIAADSRKFGFLSQKFLKLPWLLKRLKLFRMGNCLVDVWLSSPYHRRPRRYQSKNHLKELLGTALP